MAVRKVSIAIAIEGYNEYKDTVAKLNRENKLLEAQMKVVDSAYRNSSQSIEHFQAKSKVLGDQMALQKRKYDVITTELAKARNEQEKWAKAVEDSEKKMLNASKEFKTYADKHKELNAELEEAKQTLTEAKVQLAEYTKAGGNNASVIEKMKKEIADAEANVKRLNTEINDNAELMRIAASYVDDYNNEYQDNVAGMEAATRGVQELELAQKNQLLTMDKLSDSYGQNQHNIAELNGTLGETDEAFKEMIKGAEDGDKALEDYKEEAENAEKSTDDLNKELTEGGDAGKTYADKVAPAVDVMASMMVAEKVAGAVKKLKDAIMETVNASVGYEAAFANVTKTVDGTDEELAQLSDDIKEMSQRLPYSTTEIANLASIAGQLGIKTSDIKEFTETMIGLGISTNITADNAATLLAQFQNVTGFDSSNIRNIASVIIDLGNHTATTEAEIMEMAQRFASAGTLAGLSAPEILGMSAALSSVGIRAEAGGTTLSKMTQRIQSAVETGSEDLQNFAKIAGVSAEDFAKAWEESPVKAINMFLAGLHGTYEEGDSVLKFLDELNLNEVRLRNTVSALAASEKDLAYYTDMANDAFGSTVAYDTEVGRFLKTTKTKTELLSNSFDLLKIEVGDALKPAFDNLLTSGRDIVEWATDFISKNPELVQVLAGIATLIGGITLAITGYKAAVTLANVVTEIFGKTLTATSVGAITAAVVGLVAAVGALAVAFRENQPTAEEFRTLGYDLSESIDTWNKKIEDTGVATEQTAKKADEYIRKLEDLKAQADLGKDVHEEYARYVGLLKDIMPDLNLELDEETGFLKESTQALRDQIKEWKNKAKVEAYQSKITSLYRSQLDLETEEKKILGEIDRLNSENHDKIVRRLTVESEMEQLKYDMQSDNIDIASKAQAQYDTLSGELQQLNEDLKDYDYAMKGNNLALEQNREEQKKVQEELELTEQGFEEVTEAINGNSEATRRGGADTIATYVDGALRYMNSEEWAAFRKATQGKVSEVVGTWGTDAYRKGQEISKQLGLGIISSINSVKEAGRKINEALASTLRSKDYRWKMKVQNGIASYVAMFAEGGVVNRATPAIVGEAGTEAIIPLKKLPDIMTKYMQNQQSMSNFYGARSSSQQRDVDTIVSLLNRYLPKMSNQQVVLDSNKLVGTLAPKMDTYFTNQLIAEGRGQ